MDRIKFVKNVYSHLISMLMASIMFIMITQLIKWPSKDTGGEAVSWLTR
ncbi:hypothetical protein [Mesobacillus jeotgali]|nr:hypothetical protein [Mesobacillus jeotgali]